MWTAPCASTTQSRQTKQQQRHTPAEQAEHRAHRHHARQAQLRGQEAVRQPARWRHSRRRRRGPPPAARVREAKRAPPRPRLRRIRPRPDQEAAVVAVVVTTRINIVLFFISTFIVVECWRPLEAGTYAPMLSRCVVRASTVHMIKRGLHTASCHKMEMWHGDQKGFFLSQICCKVVSSCYVHLVTQRFRCDTVRENGSTAAKGTESTLLGGRGPAPRGATPSQVPPTTAACRAPTTTLPPSHRTRRTTRSNRRTRCGEEA